MMSHDTILICISALLMFAAGCSNDGVSSDDTGGVDAGEDANEDAGGDGGTSDAGDVCSGDITLTGAVDATVLAALRACQNIAGDVVIDSVDWTTTPTFDATRIQGDLIVRNNATLEDIIGFVGLEEVTGAVWLENNAELSSLFGRLQLPPRLRSVGELRLVGLPSLTSVHGCEGLTSVAGDVVMRDNAALTGIGSLYALTSIGGDLTLDDNDALRDLGGVSSLAAIGGDLVISNNSALDDATGLSALTELGGSVTVNDNPNLPGCQAEGLAARLGVPCACSNNGSCEEEPAAAQVQAIFNAKCIICHTSGFASEGLELDSFESTTVNVASHQSDLDLIEPGQPQASYLFRKIEGTHTEAGGGGQAMPLGNEGINTQEINTVRDFIEGMPRR